VHPHGVDIGAVEQRLVSGRIVGSDLLDQFELAKEAGPLGRDGRRPVLQAVLEQGGRI
jgi:hypothetical protein